MMKNNLILLILLLMLSLFPTNGQMALGYNTDGNTLSLSTNPDNRVWGEFRVNTKSYSQAPWSYSDRGITQVYALAGIFNARNVILYAGGGVGANLLANDEKWLSVNIPAGIRIAPFTKFPGVIVTGEYNPMLVVAETVPIIHSMSIGLRILLLKGE
jgi:hypothetical protein